jgi:hypothetical protein
VGGGPFQSGLSGAPDIRFGVERQNSMLRCNNSQAAEQRERIANAIVDYC